MDLSSTVLLKRDLADYLRSLDVSSGDLRYVRKMFGAYRWDRLEHLPPLYWTVDAMMDFARENGLLSESSNADDEAIFTFVCVERERGQHE